MRVLLSLLVASVTAVAGVGCGSDDDSDGGQPEWEQDGAVESGDSGDSGPQASASRLSQDALEELEALNASRFLGKAVVAFEEEQDNATKVTFDPDSGPICMRGAEFWAFYADRGSDKTVILLQGGGACWSALCSATETAQEQITTTGPASPDPDNPFGDWNLVFVPYCDGSVFAGDSEVTEPDGSTRYHHGRQNLAAAIDVASEQFGHSTQILIGGFSAGGYGTISGMVAVRLAFPQVDLFVMNDSGPGVQNSANAEATGQRIEEWGHAKYFPPSCTGCDGGYGQSTQMYQWMLDNDETVKISMLSYFEDAVIGAGYNGLTGAEYKELLLTETDKIHDSHPERFKRFMLPGASHVVSAGWGTVTADGVEVSDWVEAMVTGDDSVWRDILASGP